MFWRCPKAEARTLISMRIINTREVEGTTYYVIIVSIADEGRSGSKEGASSGGYGGSSSGSASEGGILKPGPFRQVHVLKRFSDFQRLDQTLRKAIAESSSGKLRYLPALPDADYVRHKMNLGDFNEKRQEGLQKYLNNIVENVSTPEEQPAVKAFLDTDHVEPGKSHKGKDRSMSRGRSGHRHAVAGDDLPVDVSAIQSMKIISSRDAKLGPTWYLIRITAPDREWFVVKRYTDFERLDSALQADRAERLAQGAPVLQLAEMPEKSVVRHALDPNDFNEKRKKSLQNYADVLMQQVSTLGVVPGLEEFVVSGVCNKDRVRQAGFQVPADWQPNQENSPTPSSTDLPYERGRTRSTDLPGVKDRTTSPADSPEDEGLERSLAGGA